VRGVSEMCDCHKTQKVQLRVLSKGKVCDAHAAGTIVNASVQ
jgi:hypothetical protein